MNKDSKAAIDAAMAKAGFVDAPDHPVHGLVGALSENGPYTVLGSWSKGDVKVHLEQNTAPSEPGSDTMTVYPPVLVIENGTGGRVNLQVHDLESIAAGLAGDIEF